MRPMYRATSLFGLAAILVIGCGGSREAAWDTLPASGAAQSQSAEAQTQRTALLAEAAAAWEKRDDPAQIRDAITKWQQALEINPDDPETWTMVSRGYYLVADCHLRFDESKHEEMVNTFEQGTQAAERALVAMSDEFADRMRAGTRIEEALDVLSPEAVPALYWRSSNMGKWGSEKDFATLLAYKDEVRAVMTYCLEKDPNYFHAGPHRYFGAYFARLPSFAGGDLERSREHFERSLAVEQNYFGTHVLYAEDYSVKSQNRALFEEHLNYVISGDPNALPDVAPENRCEQRKAERALSTADEIFE